MHWNVCGKYIKKYYKYCREGVIIKIGFVIPSMGKGGAERVTSVLCNEFQKNGNQIFLYFFENVDNISYKLDEKILIRRLFIATNSKKIKKFLNIKNQLAKNFRDDSLDLVVSFITRANILSILASKKCKIPCIISERNNPYLVPSSYIFRKIRDFVYRFGEGFVFQTKYARDYYCKKIQKNSKIILNPVNINIEIYNKNYNDRKNVIFTACRLEPQKNIRLLIDSFAKIANDSLDYELEIYGDGEERSTLEKYVYELKLQRKIKFMGVTNNMFDIMVNRKIFVLPSNFEGLSNSLIEAMCCGNACVVTDSPTYGNRELIIDGENGFLVPVNDTNSMSLKILELIKNDEIGNRISANAQKVHQKTNVENIVNEWLKYIESIVK